MAGSLGRGAAKYQEDGPVDDGVPDPPTRTLGSQDPEATAMYLQKNYKSTIPISPKKNKRLDSSKFLSNVVENDKAIHFRFNFTIVGLHVDRLGQAVCNSEAAKSLGGAGLESAGYRCLCEVPGYAGEASKVAKLAFSVAGFDKDIRPSKTRQGALSSAIVFALDTKETEGDQNFGDQLEMLREAVQRLRSTTRARLRPVKALLLWNSEQDPARLASGLQSWAVQLADFEQTYGDMWKFGPVSEQDGNSLHEIFAEMTSARILHMDMEGGPFCESDEVNHPGTPEDEETSFTPSAGHMMRRPSSSASSSVSEHERPPVFAAEESGSECGDDALELHAQTFGVTLPEAIRGRAGHIRT